MPSYEKIHSQKFIKKLINFAEILIFVLFIKSQKDKKKNFSNK